MAKKPTINTPTRVDRKIGQTTRDSIDSRHPRTDDTIRDASEGEGRSQCRSTSSAAPAAIGRPHDVTETRPNGVNSRNPPVAITETPTRMNPTADPSQARAHTGTVRAARS